MSAIIAAFVDHPRTIISVMCLVLIALIEVAVYRAGGNAVADKIHAEQVMAQRKSDSVMAGALSKLATVKAQNDSLRTRADSMPTVVATRRKSANLVNARLVLHGDTAQVATDTGIVAIPIPHDLTRQLAAMQTVNDSLVSALDREHEADTALVQGLTQQVAIDSTVQIEYRKQLAAAQARIAADEAKPKHSLALVFLGGAATALAGVITLAVVF